jgi:squalene-hopene/tetraprenyl-beta-curcumene cyclase
MASQIAGLDRTIETLTGRLLDSRNRDGHWEGILSSSALSTATASIALMLAGDTQSAAESQGNAALIRAALDWLVAHQNGDGGWGDTVVSFSNVSTTSLCWAALSLGEERDGRCRPAIEQAERWLRSDAGDLSETALRTTILTRYGKDRTFSVPILTVLALAGKLGRGAAAWRQVPQLPFELAACPHRWFQWLRLPVVSYALPALVAMGQARHHHAPSRNLPLRAVRDALRERTLVKLRAMQPASGGYLEATPLTAFVTMSLIAAGQRDHPVVRDGLRFLIESARPDGSWPIDTNLATWLTTWSIKTLADACAEGTGPQAVGQGFSPGVVEWLLAQQHREEHPYTHAAPGGWAWTDRPGGVPDADDTAGALIALGKLAHGEPRVRAAAEAGLTWLLDVQNRDGGIPTFCRGWGALPFDRSAPDLAAHALEAWSDWRSAMPAPLQRRIDLGADRVIRYLASSQHADGSWSPLWFGNQHVRNEMNLTYGTAQVVAALSGELARRSVLGIEMRDRGVRWLRTNQNADGGWGGGVGSPSSIEETGITLHALGTAAAADVRESLTRGVNWLLAATDEGRHLSPAPIGLYFARLWYFEELYPVIFALRGLLSARSCV